MTPDQNSRESGFADQSFRDRIERELAGRHPPATGGIPGAALARGRRIRRRQRMAGMVGGVAAVAGVAAAVVGLDGGLLAGGTGTAAVAPGRAGVAGPASPTASRTATPSPTPSTARPFTPAPPRPDSPASTSRSSTSTSTSMAPPSTVIGKIPASWKPPAAGGTLTDPRHTDGQSVAELLVEDLGLIGSGSGSGFSGGSMSGFNANATLTWTTPHGSTRISASVTDESMDGRPAPTAQCSRTYGTDYCASATLEDGSVVMVEHGSGYPAGSLHPARSTTVMITRPDHAAINIVEWSDGPFTDDQLYAIVADPRWGLEMDGSFVSHADQVIRPFSGG